MKKEPGRDLVLFAGASLASTFIELDLVDDYRLMVHPIILGAGVSLFRDIRTEHTLRLVRARTFGSGVTLLQYQRDGTA